MKLITTFLLLFFPITLLEALPIGILTDPCILSEGIFCSTEAFSVRFGFYGDYVFNRHLETKPENSSDYHTLSDVKLYTNAGYAGINLCGIVEVFGTAGTTHVQLHDACQSAFVGINPQGGFLPFRLPDRCEIDCATYFSYSAGIRGAPIKCGPLTLGVEGQYFYTHPHVNRIVGMMEIVGYLDDIRLKYREWQLGGTLTYAICPGSHISLLPYIGLKWSHVCADLNLTQVVISNSDITSFDFAIDKIRNQRAIGYAVGCELIGGKKIGIMVEARFVDELAFYFNGLLRF